MMGLERRAALSAAIAMAMIFARANAASSEDDKKKIMQCATDICGIIVSKNPKGPDLTCDLNKTWEGKQIEKGAESKNIGWGFGAVTCHIKVNLKRADIVAALSTHNGRLKMGKQSVACEIGEDRYPIKATAAPELKFKDGTDTEATLDVADIEGAPLIRGVVWTAAQLERHAGIFEKDLVREINKFIQKECPKFVEPAK
jgi:hypothetical protein